MRLSGSPKDLFAPSHGLDGWIQRSLLLGRLLRELEREMVIRYIQ